jgi:hypothetical protein
MEIANFFWHGYPLTVYENTCLASFVKRGFDVNLWCFDAMDAPEGVRIRDASEILPREDIRKFSQDGRKGNISAFANAFRYKLLSEREGWWFDTDIVCLANSKKFAAVSAQRPIVCGREDKTTINNAVIKVPDKQIAHEFVAELERSGVSGPWGFLGPQLVTRTLKNLDLLRLAAPREVFYPIHWSQFDAALLPGRRSEAEQLCAGALTYHIWNEYLNRVSFPKNLLPPEGSFLHEQIMENYPAARGMAALPAETMTALLAGYILRRQTEHFFKMVSSKMPKPQLV